MFMKDEARDAWCVRAQQHRQQKQRMAIMCKCVAVCVMSYRKALSSMIKRWDITSLPPCIRPIVLLRAKGKKVRRTTSIPGPPTAQI